MSEMILSSWELLLCVQMCNMFHELCDISCNIVNFDVAKSIFSCVIYCFFSNQCHSFLINILGIEWIIVMRTTKCTCMACFTHNQPPSSNPILKVQFMHIYALLCHYCTDLFHSVLQ